MSEGFVTVILAAGQGTRMKSELPKVMHQVAGVPMYAHVVQAALDAGSREVVVVVGHGRELVERDVKARFPDRVSTAVQAQQLGTGDAVRAGMAPLAEFGGYVVVLYGDTPLVHTELVRALMQQTEASSPAAVVLTCEQSDPTGYGRILRDAAGRVRLIREHKDASPSERETTEIN
ncbi:MAG: N-acetylglucosamine-phosphate uridyltransferase, partial [Myxococcaceae bacterium]|nr:N-acetylglucosamine-phosphate uridyltransferase [Myxococcaceae bacterium]